MTSSPSIADFSPATAAWRRSLLLVAGGIGLIVAAAALASPRDEAVLVFHFGLFLTSYAALIAASRWRDPPWGKRLDRFIDGWVSDAGAGFYGVVALSFFLGLEARTLLDEFAMDQSGIDAARRLAWEWLIGFSVESMMNSIWAGLWPMILLREHPPFTVALFAAAAWAVFKGGTLLFPDVPFAVADEDDSLEE